MLNCEEHAMPNQAESKDGIPRKDKDRPSPDVEGYAADGQSGMRGKGATDKQAQPPRQHLSDRNPPSDPASRRK
jgi:hypothetical protein